MLGICSRVFGFDFFPSLLSLLSLDGVVGEIGIGFRSVEAVVLAIPFFKEEDDVFGEAIEWEDDWDMIFSRFRGTTKEAFDLPIAPFLGPLR